jgi:hypothetical protein
LFNLEAPAKELFFNFDNYKSNFNDYSLLKEQVTRIKPLFVNVKVNFLDFDSPIKILEVLGYRIKRKVFNKLTLIREK